MNDTAPLDALASSPRPRVLLVDDEPPARRRLRRLLEARDDIELVGESGDGRSAVDAIHQLRPDLVFLDIQMPDLDGFGVLEAIGPENMPAVVFVTAYDEYALDAFDLNVLDYLLKPYTDERFGQALQRALRDLRRQRSEEVCERLACLLAARGPQPEPDTPASGPLRRIAVHHGERIVFVPVAEIDWIEAEGAYVRLHRGPQTHLVRDSLKRLETQLDPEHFVRIHRSTIVRIDRVIEMTPLFHGEYELTLSTGAKLKLSRSYRDRLPRIQRG
ncbi:MAG: LytTR family DNA-binding domain-containing protein [Acidobacteriota bacterium]